MRLPRSRCGCIKAASFSWDGYLLSRPITLPEERGIVIVVDAIVPDSHVVTDVGFTDRLDRVRGSMWGVSGGDSRPSRLADA